MSFFLPFEKKLTINNDKRKKLSWFFLSNFIYKSIMHVYNKKKKSLTIQSYSPNKNFFVWKKLDWKFSLSWSIKELAIYILLLENWKL